jgi:hypothetical protein
LTAGQQTSPLVVQGATVQSTPTPPLSPPLPLTDPLLELLLVVLLLLPVVPLLLLVLVAPLELPDDEDAPSGVVPASSPELLELLHAIATGRPTTQIDTYAVFIRKWPTRNTRTRVAA